MALRAHTVVKSEGAFGPRGSSVGLRESAAPECSASMAWWSCGCSAKSSKKNYSCNSFPQLWDFFTFSVDKFFQR